MFPSAAINYLTKKFCVKHWKPPLESAIGQRGMRDTQIKEAVTVAFVCFQEFETKTLLLKISHTLDIGLGGVE